MGARLSRSETPQSEYQDPGAWVIWLRSWLTDLGSWAWTLASVIVDVAIGDLRIGRRNIPYLMDDATFRGPDAIFKLDYIAEEEIFVFRSPQRSANPRQQNFPQ